MTIIVRIAFVIGQVLGVAALLLGILILWGLGWALLVGGLIVVAGSTAFEALALGDRAAPSDRQSVPSASEVL